MEGVADRLKDLYDSKYGKTIMLIGGALAVVTFIKARENAAANQAAQAAANTGGTTTTPTTVNQSGPGNSTGTTTGSSTGTDTGTAGAQVGANKIVLSFATDLGNSTGVTGQTGLTGQTSDQYQFDSKLGSQTGTTSTSAGSSGITIAGFGFGGGSSSTSTNSSLTAGETSQNITQSSQFNQTGQFGVNNVQKISNSGSIELDNPQGSQLTDVLSFFLAEGGTRDQQSNDLSKTNEQNMSSEWQAEQYAAQQLAPQASNVGTGSKTGSHPPGTSLTSTPTPTPTPVTIGGTTAGTNLPPVPNAIITGNQNQVLPNSLAA